MRKTILLSGSAVLALIVGLGVYLTESPTRPTANTGAEKKQEAGSSALSVPSSVSRKSGVSTPSQQPSLGTADEASPSAPAPGTSRTGKLITGPAGTAPKHSEGGITGVPVTAKVTAADGTHDFAPNTLGKFPGSTSAWGTRSVSQWRIRKARPGISSRSSPRTAGASMENKS
jgi:hypothetical protein